MLSMKCYSLVIFFIHSSFFDLSFSFPSNVRAKRTFWDDASLSFFISDCWAKMCIYLVLSYMKSRIISNKQRAEKEKKRERARIVENDMRFDKDRSSLLRSRMEKRFMTGNCVRTSDANIKWNSYIYTANKLFAFVAWICFNTFTLENVWISEDFKTHFFAFHRRSWNRRFIHSLKSSAQVLFRYKN